jgi:hypothetical protein
LKELRFNIYGSHIVVSGRQGAWTACYYGAEGKRRPADFVIPGDVGEAELCAYLADLFHEHATPRNHITEQLP